MTRENKLALVLGFGLMLFVGILVSDHLAARQSPPLAMATAQRAEAGIPPLPPPGGTDMKLSGDQGMRALEVPKPTPGPVEGMDEGAGSREGEVVAQLPSGIKNRGSNREGGREPDSGHAFSGARPDAPTDRTYQIKQGDTFAAIAQREYGRRSLGEKLAQVNGLNPNKLKVGATVKLPPMTELDPSAIVAQGPPTTPNPPKGDGNGALTPGAELPKFKVYKVREGDTLFGIAQRELGKGDRWKELQSSNPDVLKDRDDLTPGMQLKIPVMTASAERSIDA